MKHIGTLIREARQEAKMSAESVAKQLPKPITKQAFVYREINGSFEWEDVIAVAKILKVNPKKFLPDRQIKIVETDPAS